MLQLAFLSHQPRRAKARLTRRRRTRTKKKIQAYAGATAKVGVAATASLSHTDKETRTEMESRSQRLEKSVSRCSSYVAAIEYGDFPEPDPEFQKRVTAAGISLSKHYDIFDEFGTHFFTTVKMGARTTVTNYIRKDDYSTMMTELKGVGASVGVSAGAAAGVKVGISKGPPPAGIAKGKGNAIGYGKKSR